MEVNGAGQFLPQLKQWVSLHPDHDPRCVPQSRMPHLIVLQGKIPPAARQRPAGILFRATRPVSSHMDSTAPGTISGKSICADGPTGT